MSIEIKEQDEKLRVYSPYNPEYVRELKSQISGGKFDYSDKAWVLPLEAKETVEGLLQKHYGYSPENIKICTVIITANETLYGDQDSVRCAGFPIARATGRDSGAKVCENVYLLSGDINSGGSVKNWTTKVKENAQFKITKFPESSLEKIDSDKWSYSVIQEKSQKEKLEEKKAKLLSTLAEVEKQLKELE